MNHKTYSIDPLLLSNEGLAHGISENNDSTAKKLIYQIPFSSVGYMSGLLAQLD